VKVTRVGWISGLAGAFVLLLMGCDKLEPNEVGDTLRLAEMLDGWGAELLEVSVDTTLDQGVEDGDTVREYPLPEQPVWEIPGDLTQDGVVDVSDLAQFSQEQLGRSWEGVDWCRWSTEDNSGVEVWANTIESLFGCSGPIDPFVIRNHNDFPTRLSWSPSGRLYVSDARVRSVFIYEPLPGGGLWQWGQLTLPGQPLGVAVDSFGNLYVGDTDADGVEVFGRDGRHVAWLGLGHILMPNDLDFDSDDKLYVADSQANRIWVIAPGLPVRSIGQGQLNFPSALAVWGDRVYVGDQGNNRIKVFDLEGNPVATYSEKVRQGSLGYRVEGRLAKVQGLDLDPIGQLHVLDTRISSVQVFSRFDGTFQGSYLEYGQGPDNLNLPLDIAINASGLAAIADAGNKRLRLVEVGQ